MILGDDSKNTNNVAKQFSSLVKSNTDEKPARIDKLPNRITYNNPQLVIDFYHTDSFLKDLLQCISAAVYNVVVE